MAGIRAGRRAPSGGGIIPASYAAGRYTVPPGGSATDSLAEAECRYIPVFIPKDCTVDRIGIEVTTAGIGGAPVARLGIYADDGDGKPGARLVDAGTVSTTTTGGKEIIISQALTKGLYWLAVAAQGGATTFAAFRVTGATGAGMQTTHPTLTSATLTGAGGYTQSGISGALPATATPGNNHANPVRAVLRFV